MPKNLFITHPKAASIEEGLRKEVKNFHEVSGEEAEAILKAENSPPYIVRPAKEEPNTLYINYLDGNRVRKIHVDITEEGEYQTGKAKITTHTAKQLNTFASIAAGGRQEFSNTPPPPSSQRGVPPPPRSPNSALPPSPKMLVDKLPTPTKPLAFTPPPGGPSYVPPPPPKASGDKPAPPRKGF